MTTQDRENEDNTREGREGRRGDREGVKMREGRERGTEDENHVPQKHKQNAGASEKVLFYTSKIQKILRVFQ